jgi:hypothetical protein
MATELSARVQRALRKAKTVIARLSDFDIEEVSLVDRPANKRPFIVRKREDAPMTSKKAVTVLKGLATPMETLATVVAKLDEGVNAEQLASLQDKARALAAELRELVPDAAGAAPTETVKLTESATSALEQLTEVADKLKAGEVSDEDLAAAKKTIADVAETLGALGEKLSASAEGEGDGAAAPAGDPPTDAGEGEGSSDEGSEDGGSSEGEGDASGSEGEGSADESGDGEGEGASEGTPAGDPPAEGESAQASAEPMKPEEVVEVSEELAQAAELIATETMTQEAAVELQKRFDDTFLRGGVTIDTGDMEVLEKVVAMIAKVMEGGKTDLAKRAEVFKAAFNEIGTELRDIAKSVKGAETVATAVFKRAAGLKMAVSHLAKNLDAAQPAQAASGVDVAAIVKEQVTAQLNELTETQVKPLAKRVGDLEAENKKLKSENETLRSEIKKNEGTPATARASTPSGEAGESGGGAGADLFPMNYNAETMS